MYRFINGWKAPKFRIKNGATLVANILLPITEGLIENVQELRTEHELLNYNIIKNVHGYRLSWSLPYKSYTHKDTMLNIQQILRYLKAGYKVYLTPRLDCPWREYEVIFDGELEFGLHGHGANAVGNKGVEIRFTTKSLIDDLNWVDPDDIIYYGWFRFPAMGVLEI